MGKLIARLLVNAAALWLAAELVAGIDYGAQLTTLLVVALLFGVVNALIKPIVAFFTCPFYMLTLGLFTFIVNALMLLLTSAIAQGLGVPFVVDGFGAALLGAIVVGVASWVLSLFVGGDERKEKS